MDQYDSTARNAFRPAMNHNKALLVTVTGVAVGTLTAITSSYWPLIVSMFTYLLIVFFLSLFLMQKTVVVLNIKRLTIPGFFYLTYLVMIFFPALFIAVDKPASYRNIYLLAVGSVLLTVSLGVCFANLLFRFKKREINAFFLKPVEGGKPSYSRRMVLGIFLTGATALVLLFLSEVKAVPLFAAIKNPGAYRELAQLREEGFKLLDTGLA